MSSNLNVFVARQPIFDRCNRVVAYELLFRSGITNQANVVDGNSATGQVLTASYLDIGLPDLTAGKRAYVNFGRDMILDGTPKALPPDQVVIEILEDVTVDTALVEAVRDLKAGGYTVALDDFTGQTGLAELLPLVDIVKVDLLGVSNGGLDDCLDRIGRESRRGCLLLAEKVEDRGALKKAQQQGFDLFQGYFFCRPEVVQATRLPESRLARTRLLRTFSLLASDLNRLEETIKSDVSLTARLLRYINAAAFPWAGRVRSVRHALVLLGENNLRKWIALVALGQLDSDKPWELAVASNIRGRLCESIGPYLVEKHSDLDCFLLGALSILDAMVDRPISELVQEIPVSESVREALLGGDGILGDLLHLSVACEQGDWEAIRDLATRLGVSGDGLAEIHREAILWSDRVLHLE